MGQDDPWNLRLCWRRDNFLQPYCDNPALKSWIEKAARPNIEFLLRIQLPHGTWSKYEQESWDRTSNPGIINYLTCYYERVDRNLRIVQAVQRFDAFVVVPENGKSLGLLSDGASPGPKDTANAFNTVTAITDVLLRTSFRQASMQRGESHAATRCVTET